MNGPPTRNCGSFRLSPDLAEMLNVDAAGVAGQPLTRVLRLEEDEHGEMPLISALAVAAHFHRPACAQPSR